MYYKNPISRYIFRRKVLRRVKMRLDYYKRLISKDLFDDMAYILKDRDINTIFDVGANIGFVTFQFQKRFQRSDIYCFEPNPSVFSVLKESYKNEKFIHAFQVGIADKSGELLFNVNANTGTSSFLLPTEYHKSHQAKHTKEPILIPVLTIDDFSTKNSIRHIDILKLDIEGYELKALQGAREMLYNQAIDVIYTEVCLVRQYEDQPLFHEITAYLEKQDYHLFNIDSFVGQETLIKQAMIGNATYISANFRRYLEEKFGAENCGW